MKKTGSTQTRGSKKGLARSQNDEQQNWTQASHMQRSNSAAGVTESYQTSDAFMTGSPITYASAQKGNSSSSSSTPRQVQYSSFEQMSTPPDLKRILHLYIHDYCLKQNYIKAANSIAADTGVRTDEGVPIGKEAPGGLLLQWFSQFWEVFAEKNTTATSSDKDVRSFQAVQQPSHLPSFMTSSSTMRRTETEPTRGSVFMNEMRGDTMMHSPDKPDAMSSHLSTAMTNAQSWNGPAESYRDQFSRERVVPAAALSQSAQDDTSVLIQKMGWGDQKYEDLDIKDKHQLIDVLRRSQMAQQQALERMAHVYPNSVEPSSHRSFNGTAFQQMPSSIPLSPPEMGARSFSTPQPSPGLNIAFQQQQSTPSSTSTSNNSKKSIGAGSGRKKRRSSINAQNASQLHFPSNATPGISSVKDVFNHNEPFSAQLAPSPNISGALPSVLQRENSSSFEQRPSVMDSNQGQGSKQRSKSVIASPTRGNTSNNSFSAHQAQNEATSQASSQINAQIAQLQNQVKSKGNAQSNSSQISQLKMLQEKLNYNAKSAENDWSKQQQQQPPPPNFMARPTMNGDMGPPPSPGFQPTLSYAQQQQIQHLPFTVDSQGHLQSLSTPGTPALTTSSTMSNSTPDWRDVPNRMIQDSPTSINMQGVSTQISPQSLAAFGASIDSSHLNHSMMMGAPPPASPHGQQIQTPHQQQQQQQHQYYFQGSDQGYNPQQQLLKSPMNLENSTESSNLINFDWNSMGSM